VHAGDDELAGAEAQAGGQRLWAYDGRLITGQRQHSGGKVAELVIDALGR
jgi:hypothetical protein